MLLNFRVFGDLQGKGMKFVGGMDLNLRRNIHSIANCKRKLGLVFLFSAACSSSFLLFSPSHIASSSFSHAGQSSSSSLPPPLFPSSLHARKTHERRHCRCHRLLSTTTAAENSCHCRLVLPPPPTAATILLLLVGSVF